LKKSEKNRGVVKSQNKRENNSTLKKEKKYKTKNPRKDNDEPRIDDKVKKTLIKK
jgi:hypothetical protein